MVRILPKIPNQLYFYSFCARDRTKINNITLDSIRVTRTTRANSDTYKYPMKWQMGVTPSVGRSIETLHATVTPDDFLLGAISFVNVQKENLEFILYLFKQ